MKFVKFMLFLVGLVGIISHFYLKKQEINILADNIYFEARNSTVEDQISVALVTLNRAASVKYPAKIKDVVFQKGQFSWTVEYSKPNRDTKSWKKSYAIAEMVYKNYEYFKRNDVCLHYATYISNENNHWTRNIKKRTKIGKHIYFCD